MDLPVCVCERVRGACVQVCTCAHARVCVRLCVHAYVVERGRQADLGWFSVRAVRIFILTAQFSKLQAGGDDFVKQLLMTDMPLVCEACSFKAVLFFFFFV